MIKSKNEAAALTSVIIATHNEAGSVEPLIEDILKHVPAPLEVIIVDDNSTDGTWQNIEAMNRPEIILIRRLKAHGLASAMMRGFIESKGARIGWMDADAWMMPPRLPEMLGLLDRHDIVVASRYVPGGGDERGGVRVLASQAINRFACFVLGPQLHDYTSNFAVMRRSVFNEVIPLPLGFGEYFIELVHCAVARGLSVHEVPYFLGDRQEGASKAFSNPFRFMRLGLQYIFRICLIRLRDFS